MIVLWGVTEGVEFLQAPGQSIRERYGRWTAGRRGEQTKPSARGEELRPPPYLATDGGSRCQIYILALLASTPPTHENQRTNQGRVPHRKQIMKEKNPFESLPSQQALRESNLALISTLSLFRPPVFYQISPP